MGNPNDPILFDWFRELTFKLLECTLNQSDREVDRFA